MRTAFYGRYSTDQQRDTSIEDQLRNCERFAQREGWAIAVQYADRGISGSSRHRPQYQALLAAAVAGDFDVVLIDDLSRLSRDDVETKQTIRRLKYLGIRIVGVSDGFDSAAKSYKIQASVRGLVNEIYLDDLREKTHRGLSGQVLRGFSAGGISYGYRSTDVGDGHRLEVDPDQAVWVRWIFEHYAAGWSCQRIAAELNRRHVASPRGSTWAVSALYGSPAKGSGVLNNELYVGRYIWNRSAWVKDPETDRRKRLQRPRNEWMVADRPELRILTDAAWQAARDRMSAARTEGGSRGKGARLRTLFGGILRCAHCGGAVVATSAHAYGCAARKDRGTCPGVSAPRKATDTRLLTCLREDLLAPDAIAELQRAVAGLLAQQAAEAAKDGHSTRARLGDLDREIDNLTAAVAAMGLSDALRDKLAKAEAERRQLRARVAPPADLPTIENVTGRYREMVANLGARLGQDTDRARADLRALFGDIRLTNENGEVWAEVSARADRMLLAAGGVTLGVVAGARFATQKRVRIR